jgi:hypothetical protein
LMDVIEHIDPPRLAALERTVFGHAAPRTVIVTTPNIQYNVRFEALPAWGDAASGSPVRVDAGAVPRLGGRVATEFAPGVRFVPVGPDAPQLGPPTQMAVFGKRPTRWWWRDPRVCGSGTEPGRAGRDKRGGEVDVRAGSLPAHQGDLLRLLPPRGGRRREWPGYLICPPNRPSRVGRTGLSARTGRVGRWS